MPSAASYTNKLRVAAQTRGRKVQLPGGMANATQSMRSACNISMSYVPVAYNVPCPCNKFPPPKPTGCVRDERVYFSDGTDLCNIIDGGEHTVLGTVVYDAGVDCI
jgi:hypothetical protein